MENVDLSQPIVQKVEVLGFRVSVLQVQLGQSARLAIHLNCILDGKPFIQYKEMVIEGEEYLSWGSDDNYIMELVKLKLGEL
jgi:hypothetical protein